jgi:hypothetical protein
LVRAQKKWKASMNVNLSGTVTEQLGGTGTSIGMSITSPMEVEIGGITGAPAIDTSMTLGGSVATDITLHTPDVLRTNSDIRSDSRMFVDLRPVVMDMCATVNFGRVPEACVRQPYEHRIRMTFFGTEIMALEFRGESRTYIENMPGRPTVVGAARGDDPHARYPGARSEHQRSFDDPPADGGPGLVIPI